MKGLDLSKFKKVSEGKDKTTLQHPDGHQIMIAHSALSPKLREDLKKLSPVKMMAEGGDPEESSDEAPVQAPEETDLPPAPEGLTDIQALEKEAPVAMDESSPAEAKDSPADVPAQGLAKVAPAAPKGMKASAAPDVPMAQPPTQATPFPVQQQVQPAPLPRPTFQQVKDDELQKLQNETSAYHDDILKGHITPKTYSSLFQDQSTVGKLGSIFGMMMSSIGSSLSGQPNAFMSIMDKQIDNDLQAQKQSASNAQNFYQLNLQKELNQASILKTKADQLLVEANITKVPEERERLRAEANHINAEAKNTRATAKATAYTNSQTQAITSMYETFANSPAGQTPAGQQTLAMMYPQVQAKLLTANAHLAGMKAWSKMTAGQEQGEGEGEDPTQPHIDFAKLNQFQQSKYMTEGDVANARNEAEKIEKANAMQKIYNEAYDHLNTVSAGKLSPADRAAHITMINTALSREASGRFNTDEAKAQADALFPAVGDLPSTRENKRKAAATYFDSQRAATPTLTQFKLIKPAKKSYTSGTTAQFKEGTTGKDKQGNSYIVRNGKIVPIGTKVNITKK